MIALYKGKSLVSRAIRWQTRSKYSHAAWRMADGSVIEAWHRGGVARHPHLGHVHTPGTKIDLFDVEFPPGTTPSDVDTFLLRQVGKAYDFRSVFRFVTRRPELPADQDRWFCSELVVAGLYAAGAFPFRRAKPWEIDPGLLSFSPILSYRATITTGKGPGS